jgi:hypothetical protein
VPPRRPALAVGYLHLPAVAGVPSGTTRTGGSNQVGLEVTSHRPSDLTCSFGCRTRLWSLQEDKNPLSGAFQARMMGLEATTFCIGSRCDFTSTPSKAVSAVFAANIGSGSDRRSEPRARPL